MDKSNEDRPITSIFTFLLGKQRSLSRHYYFSLI